MKFSDTDWAGREGLTTKGGMVDLVLDEDRGREARLV